MVEPTESLICFIWFKVAVRVSLSASWLYKVYKSDPSKAEVKHAEHD